MIFLYNSIVFHCDGVFGSVSYAWNFSIFQCFSNKNDATLKKLKIKTNKLIDNAMFKE